MVNLPACPSRSRLRGELLELLIVEIRSANAACKNAADESDRAAATHRLKNALQVFDDLVFPASGLHASRAHPDDERRRNFAEVAIPGERRSAAAILRGEGAFLNGI